MECQGIKIEVGYISDLLLFGCTEVGSNHNIVTNIDMKKVKIKLIILGGIKHDIDFKGEVVWFL